MSSKLTLYFAPGACSLVSHIALEEVGVGFEARALALMAGEHKSPDYLAINPVGKAPTLVIDGRPLTETIAIVAWINAQYPEAGLLPKNAEWLETLSWLSATVHPIFTRFRVPPAIVEDPSMFGAVAASAAQALAGQMAIAEHRLGVSGGLLGEWSIADAFLFWLWTEALGAGFDGRAFPRVAALADQVAGRPATVRALAREAEAMAEFARRGLLAP